MNYQAFEQAKQAYKQGNFSAAVNFLRLAKTAGEPCGVVDHLLGNSYMKQGLFDAAAQSYALALTDASYGHVGSLACNRGRALLAQNKPSEAVAVLNMALKDDSYKTPYKIYLALGNAYTQLNNPRDAGVAYRNAAIDENNPQPAVALKHLGRCFMLLTRYVDAIEAYRTALDFSSPANDQNAVYSDLGLAYVAANRMNEAVDAFTKATADGSFKLSSDAQAAFEGAQKAVAAITGSKPSQTDAMLAQAGYGNVNIDPLDPTGKSGTFMPSPEDTGFFSLSEAELVEKDKKEQKAKKKHKHTFLKFIVTLLVLVLILGGVGAFAFYKGYGWPTQEMVTEQLFVSKSQGSLNTDLIASSLTTKQRDDLSNLLPDSTSAVTVSGIDRNMNESLVYATASLSKGGKQDYKISFVREGLQWKVYGVEAVFASKTSPAQAQKTSH